MLNVSKGKKFKSWKIHGKNNENILILEMILVDSWRTTDWDWSQGSKHHTFHYKLKTRIVRLHRRKGSIYKNKYLKFKSEARNVKGKYRWCGSWIESDVIEELEDIRLREKKIKLNCNRSIPDCSARIQYNGTNLRIVKNRAQLLYFFHCTIFGKM